MKAILAIWPLMHLQARRFRWLTPLSKVGIMFPRSQLKYRHFSDGRCARWRCLPGFGILGFWSLKNLLSLVSPLFLFIGFSHRKTKPKPLLLDGLPKCMFATSSWCLRWQADYICIFILLPNRASIWNMTPGRWWRMVANWHIRYWRTFRISWTLCLFIQHSSRTSWRDNFHCIGIGRKGLSWPSWFCNGR